MSVNIVVQKPKTFKQSIERKLFFQNELLARSQINLNKENQNRLSNKNLDKNYLSVCENSTSFIKLKKPDRNQQCQKNKNQPTSRHNNQDEHSPTKASGKPRRCKSTKRNILNCEQILELANKRQTYSALSLQHCSSRFAGASRVSKKDVPSKKGRKKKCGHNYSQQHIKQHKANYQHRNNHRCGEPKQIKYIPIKYPQSHSNSYIVYSDKDTTFNNTNQINKIISKEVNCNFQKNIVMSISDDYININKDLSIQSYYKNSDKRRSWAAVIIQKNWRGFLTRKLLQQYITDQQLKLKQALNAYQQNSQKYPMNLHIEKDLKQSISNQNSIKSMMKFLEVHNQINKDSSQNINSSFSTLNEAMFMNTHDNIQNSRLLKVNQSIKQNNKNQNFHLDLGQQPILGGDANYRSEQSSYDNSQDQFRRKTPVISGYSQELIQQITELNNNILKNEQLSQHNFMQSKDDSQYLNSSYQRDSQNLQLIETHLHKNIQNPKLNEQRKNLKTIKINKLDHEIIKECNTNQPQEQMSQTQIGIDWETLYTKLQQSTINSFDSLIKQAKQQLTDKMKSNNIQFFEMLKIRQKLNQFTQQLQNLFKETRSSIKTIYCDLQAVAQQNQLKLSQQMLKFYSEHHHIAQKVVNSNKQGRFHNFIKIKAAPHGNCHEISKQSESQICIQQFALLQKFPEHLFDKLQQSHIRKINKKSSHFQYNQNEVGISDNSLFHSQQEVKGEDEKLQKSKSPISEYYTLQMPTEQLSPYKQQTRSAGLQNLRIYLHNICQEYKQLNQPSLQSDRVINQNDDASYQQQQLTQTAYLCEILRKHSEIGAQNMMERCLIQLVVDLLAGQYQLQHAVYIASNWDGNYEISYMSCASHQQIIAGQNQYEQSLFQLIKKWTKQLDKWQLCSISEVSGNMEESCEISQNISQSNSPYMKDMHQ